MTDAPHIQLRTSSRSENVGVVRELLEGLASSLMMQRELTDDVKTAVSEACNNVVVHAYAGDEGPLELDATVRTGELELVIRDRGTGFRPHADRTQGSLHGVGLAVIHTYADQVQFRGRHGEGTEVRMSFTLPDQVPPALRSPNGAVTLGEPARGQLVVAVCGAGLLEAVLARVTAAMAVRAHFTVDRLSDAQLVADTVAPQAAAAALGEQIVATLESSMRQLVMRIGPLRAGAGRALCAAAPGGLGNVLERLCSEVDVEVGVDSGGAEHLRLRISDPR